MVMADTTKPAVSAKSLTINGETAKSSAATLSELLVELGYGDSKVATAVNGDFVAAAARNTCGLENDDRIEIVAPRQGG